MVVIHRMLAAYYDTGKYLTAAVTTTLAVDGFSV